MNDTKKKLKKIESELEKKHYDLIVIQDSEGLKQYKEADLEELCFYCDQIIACEKASEVKSQAKYQLG